MRPAMTRTALSAAFDLSVRLTLIGAVTTIGFLVARIIGPGIHT